jgi:hypothetical protein
VPDNAAFRLGDQRNGRFAVHSKRIYQTRFRIGRKGSHVQFVNRRPITAVLGSYRHHEGNLAPPKNGRLSRLF